LELVNRYMQRYPGATGLMMRKAQEWAGKSIVPFMWQSVMKRNTAIAEKKKSDRQFAYANGGTLYWGGMNDDDQRESVRSIGGDGGLSICLFEEATAFTEQDYNEIIARMRSPVGEYRQIILMTNPDSPLHWINQRLIIGREASVYYSSAKDNPHNPPEYLANLERLTGMQYERLVLGRWVQAEGVIYDNFSVEHNVTADAEYNPDWPIEWGVDDGYSAGQGVGTESYHPRVFLLANITPTGGVNVFYEYVVTNELTDASVQNVMALPYQHPTLAYVDSSAAELKARLWSMGLNATGATHTVSEGIKNLRRLVCDGNGVRQLKIHPRCVNLIREFQSYRYNPGTQASIGEPKPLKVDDHCLDALRYLTWHLRY
jgi:phage terminase large subunit